MKLGISRLKFTYRERQRSNKIKTDRLAKDLNRILQKVYFNGFRSMKKLLKFFFNFSLLERRLLTLHESYFLWFENYSYHFFFQNYYFFLKVFFFCFSVTYYKYLLFQWSFNLLNWVESFKFRKYFCIYHKNLIKKKIYFFLKKKYIFFFHFYTEFCKENLTLINNFYNIKKTELIVEKKKPVSLFDIIPNWITYKVTQNNVFITVLNSKGNVVLWHSAGQSGFKGPRRSTPYAAQATGVSFFKKLLKKLRLEKPIFIKGKRNFRKYIFGFLIKSARKRKVKMLLKGFFDMMKKTKRRRIKGILPKLQVKCIIRKERVSHNGLRKRKARRL